MTSAERRRPGGLNRQMMRAPEIDVLIDTEDQEYDEASDEGRFVEADLDQAHIVNSLLINPETGEPATSTIFSDPNFDDPFSAILDRTERAHAPVLDIDFPAELVPSSTPGHFHLYLDWVLPESDYFKLLDVLAEVGILEPGYVAASQSRGYSSARLPWVKKGDGTLHSDRLPLKDGERV